jgi:1-acyl-sn-glycerol-3-phosphate acyltransferase
MGLVISFLRPFVWLWCRIFFRIRFEGADNVPATGACIIAPNHVSYGDPIWITIPIKRRVYYMAWDKPFEVPMLGGLMRVFGAFPIRLESVDPKAQREAVEAIKQGRALVIFPEGGRSTDGKPAEFKMGAFRLALTQGVPIVPVSIDGGYAIWPVGRLLPRPGRLRITYHPPIRVEKIDANGGRQQLKARARQLAHATREVVASELRGGDGEPGDRSIIGGDQNGLVV